MEYLSRAEGKLGKELADRGIPFEYIPLPINPTLGVRAPFISESTRQAFGFRDEATPYDSAMAEGKGYELVLLEKEDYE